MAVLALGFLGTAIGGSIGGTILGVTAASIGGFVGSTIGSYLDNLLFPQKQEGPRLDDLNVTVSTFGKPIARLRGRSCRVAGNVFWSTKLLETKSTSGGKGAPSVQITEYSYRVSVAILLGEGVLDGIRRIWANGKTIFEDNSSSLSSVYTQGDNGAVFRTIRFYPGDSSQAPDPTMQSYVGVDDTPAYRGRSYVVIEDLQLADFGNRLPNLEFLVQAQEEITVGAVAQEIIRDCGIDPMTVSNWADEILEGYVLGSASSGVGALQPLALAYNFDVAEVGGGLRLQSRDKGPVAAIPNSDLAGHDQSEGRGDIIKWDRAKETDLPRAASLSFTDPERDWQVNTQSARRAAGSADNILDNTVPVVLSADKAREIVDRVLWEAWTARETATARTDQRHIHMEPGRVYVFETPAGWEPLRVVRLTRGWNGIIDLQLRRDRAEVYLSTSRGAAAPTPPNPLLLPGPSELQLLDIPILQDADDDTGFYLAVLGEADGWRGANVQRSIDGITFSSIAAVGAESVIGAASILPDGPRDIFDRGTILTITLLDSSQAFESLDEVDVLEGGNALYVGPQSGQGGEIIQFATAVEISPGVWELTDLLRGRLGTEHAMAGHLANDVAVLLEPGAIQREDFGSSDWNKSRDYRAVSLLEDETGVPDEAFTNTGEAKRPLSPTRVRLEYDGTDLTGSWLRRSRYRQPGLGNGPLPLGEELEAYEIDIFKGATFKRTIASSTPSFELDAAALLADGFGPGDTVSAMIYQMSGSRGRGHAAPGSFVL